MLYIRLDPLSTTTSLSISTAIEEVADTIDNNTATVTTASATIATLLSNSQYAYSDMAHKYIDSLTDSQLIEMSDQMEAIGKELEFTIGDKSYEIETPKVYVKKNVN